MKQIFAAALLALSSVAFGATTVPVQLLNPTGSTSGQAIISTGPSTAPAWGGVTVGGIAALAANTVLANATASSAAPTAFAMPSCSASGNALKWTSGTGFTCATGYGLTANPLSQFAITTSAQLAGILSDPTGTGSVVFGTSPTITTPNIVGTTAVGNAAAGSVGEFISSNIPSGSAVSLTTGAAANVTSISLTAGDWDVWGEVVSLPAGTTTQSTVIGGIGTTSATVPTLGTASPVVFSQYAPPAGTSVFVNVGTGRINVSSTTTVFLVAQVSFGVSTCSAYGVISARRRR